MAQIINFSDYAKPVPSVDATEFDLLVSLMRDFAGQKMVLIVDSEGARFEPVLDE
jgi:hypothetical protein